MNLNSLLRFFERLIPKSLYRLFQPAYHFLLAFSGAIFYNFPSRHLTVIAVTGTKGKSSTVEFINAIFEAAGYKTAITGTVRSKIGEYSEPNLTRMTIPGRFFLQRFLHRAKRAGCTIAILELTSEGARQHRHRFIDLDALVFTNLAPEHIESHGSLEAYANAKFALAEGLLRSKKRPRYMVANADDAEGARYLAVRVEHPLPFSLSQVVPWQTSDRGGNFTFDGTEIKIHLPGEFSLKNALAAATLTRALGVQPEIISAALNNLKEIAGRAQEINAGQDFSVVVDYAHTPDSLQALYDAYGKRNKICVLGSTGGGRDHWKRPLMGKIAAEHCAQIILTNEDPYNERPEDIIAELRSGMPREPEIIVDRREAIRRAISLAKPGDTVLITGKGTDPTIAGPRGTSIPWSDAKVAHEELQALLKR